MVEPRVAGDFGSEEVWLYLGPFGIGEIGEVCCSHAQ